MLLSAPASMSFARDERLVVSSWKLESSASGPDGPQRRWDRRLHPPFV